MLKMAATPKKKETLKVCRQLAPSTLAEWYERTVAVYKFGSLLSKLTQYDSIWRGKIVYQTYSYLESIISRACCSRARLKMKVFFLFLLLLLLGVSYANGRPYSQAFLADTVENGDKNRIVKTSFIVYKWVSWWACGLFLEVIEMTH